MSGDVQPRKRKDKKKKKDELSIEEPRGTAATLGEGDVFMHSQHDHGTGGHWCAKIIFFSLLAVLVTLIGLIILENRGLTELEANSVESRYSGVLEGWIDDAIDDDHHDEHTLELKHHDHSSNHKDVLGNEEDPESTEEHDNHEEDDDETNDHDIEHDEDDDEASKEEDEDAENENNETDDHGLDHEEEDDDDDEDDDDEASKEVDEDNEDDNKGDEESEKEEGENYMNLNENEDDNDDKDGFDNDINNYYTDNKAFVEHDKVKELDDDDPDEDNDTLDNNSNEDHEEMDHTYYSYKYEDEKHENVKQVPTFDSDKLETDQSSERYREEEHTEDQNYSEKDNNRHTRETKFSEEDEYEHDDDKDDDEEIEVEKIEREITDDVILSAETNLDRNSREDNVEDKSIEEEDKADESGEDDDFLEAIDDGDEPPVEIITAPSGAAFDEIEEETVYEKPPDTLADEEEYEKRQEELRKEVSETSHKDGGNSVDHLWPGEPSEARWRQELDRAEDELRQGAWQACERRVGDAALANSARARWLAAQALDMGAERKKDNTLLSRAINAYLHLLKMNEGLSNKRLKEVALRSIDRMQFGGRYLSAEPVYRLLIRRFPNEVGYRNNLTISFLMANRADLAEEVLEETLKLWPNDRVALAHYGFVLKNQHNKLEEAVVALRKALEGDAGAANEPRFYYHLGDALLLLGRPAEAHEVHKRGADLGHFLSPSQRSLYNVPRLKSRPWWRVEDTPYVSIARALEKSWREILKEGQAAKELYEKEKEGLKEKGDWTQMDLFVRGREIPGRCARAPVTCSIVRAAACRRGQVKFSSMAAGTHVRAHVGPTNCRLRMHLGLSNTRDTFIRVDKETRQWEVGKVLMFDDSFEHEVWHNGTGARLVLIVDVWHPDLTPAERRQLPAI